MNITTETWITEQPISDKRQPFRLT